MKNNILKIKSSSGRLYIFDALSNNIYETDKNSEFELINLSHLGYISNTRENPLSHEFTSRDVLKNAKTFIIEITEDCNLRCKYCTFDVAYQHERNHAKKSIDISCAKNELEKFYARTNGVEAYVVFYGGEPLLEFEKIEELVSFGNKISNNNFKYSLTTNGTLLTQEKINFFAKHKFLISISIDGPQDIHDEMRITKNKKGSLKIIENNLRKALEIQEEFFLKNITINCTISNESNIEKINNYFTSNDIFKGREIRFSPIIQKENELNKNIDQAISLDYLRKSLKSNNPVMLKPVENSFFGDVLKKIIHRKTDGLAREGKKICIPFSNRTYLRTNGSLQFCERIEFYGTTNSNNQDILHMSNFLHNEFRLMKENDCSKCFAYNFCEMCPASFISNGKLDKEKSNLKCNQYRNTVEKAIKFYIEQGEKNEEQL